MKPTGLLAACGVLAILGGLVWWTKENPKKPESTTPDAPKVLALGEDQIEEITLSKSATDPIVLKKTGGKWQITAPQAMPADQEAVKGLVSSLASLQSDRLIDQKPSDLAVFGLTEPKTEIEVKVSGGTVNKVLLGGENPSGSAVYAKLAANPAVYTILSATRSNFEKSLTDLRDKRMFTFDRAKVAAITITPAYGPAFEFGKNASNEWQLTKPRSLRADTGQVDDLLRRLVDAKMDLSGEQDEKKNAAQFTAGTQLATVSVRDATGAQAITIHKSYDNAYYGRSSAVEGTYKLTSDLAEGLKDKELGNFRNKKIFEFGFNDPTKLEIGAAGSNSGGYQKSTDKWTGPLGQTDPASVQAVIDKLRDLAATKFAYTPAVGAPALTLAITSGDKNKLEKVTLVKLGDSFSAQREGDAEGYILDAKTVEDLQQTIAGIKPFQTPKPAAKTPEKK